MKLKILFSFLFLGFCFHFVLAQDLSLLNLPVLTIDSRASSTSNNGIGNESFGYLKGSGTVTGDIVQIIDTGSDKIINLPNMSNMFTTGDDIIIATVNIGTGFPSSPNLGLFSKTISIEPNRVIYVRAWNGTSNATHYGDSVTYNVENRVDIEQLFFAGYFATTKNRNITTPNPITAFTASPKELRVELNWLNSASLDALGTLIVRSTDPIDWQPEPYEIYKSDDLPEALSLVYNASGNHFINPYSDDGLIAFQKYYYAAFAYDNAYNYSVATTLDATPSSSISVVGLNPIEYFYGKASDSKSDLEWGVSANLVVTYPFIEIWRVSSNLESSENYPISPNQSDAELVYSGSFNNNSFIDSGLLNGKHYYYAIFAKRSDGQYSEPSYLSLNPKTKGRYEAYNYPNPFSPGRAETTKIVFPVKKTGAYELYLFNMAGDVIWQYQGDATETGVDTVVWDGYTVWNKLAPNGVYLLRVVQDKKVQASAKISVSD